MDELPGEVARALAPWFERARRDLPWRRTRNPYEIWVSEVMLQQTRVDTVEVYYPAFLERFPTVEALAAADEDEVVGAWSGLGYYRRARFLHRGARFVAEKLGGRIPEAAEDLRTIPGIGPYTAGAISSFAFDRPSALVDGNVARVLSRLRAETDPKRQVATARAHWTTTQAILEQGSPRVLGNALMELGATVCTPRNPSCDECPVRSSCRAHAEGLQGEIPAPKKRKASPELHWWAVGMRWGDRLLIERRPAAGLLANMWCLPLVAREAADGDPRPNIAALFGVPVRPDGEGGEPIKHVFSHRIWHLRPYPCRASRRPAISGGDGPERMWIEPGERPDGGFPTVTERVLERLGF